MADDLIDEGMRFSASLVTQAADTIDALTARADVLEAALRDAYYVLVYIEATAHDVESDTRNATVEAVKEIRDIIDDALDREPTQ
jgi:hypothetical protein